MPAPRILPAVATLTGSTGTTTLVLVVLLIALGLAMIATAAWLVRSTRADAPALGPLEEMSTRRWARGDADHRAVALTAARPAGALAPAPIVPCDVAPAAEPLLGSSADAPPESFAEPRSGPEPEPATVNGESPVPESAASVQSSDGADEVEQVPESESS